MDYKRARWSYIASLTCLLAACGGGGSGPAPSPAPPPVAPAPPPEPVANVPDLTQPKLLSDDEMETAAFTPTPQTQADYRNWVVANHEPIRSVTYDQDFSDLQFLKSNIGDRSVVQLGESSHGTAEFSHVKTRLIKFMHQEMDFSVIAFEAGFFEGFISNERKQTNSADSLMQFLFSVWNTDEVLEVFDYVKQTQSTSRPLQFVGFDSQISSSYFREVDDFVLNLPLRTGFGDALRSELAQELIRVSNVQSDFNNQGCFNGRSTACDNVIATMRNVEATLEGLEAQLDAITNPERDLRVLSLVTFAAKGQMGLSVANYETAFAGGGNLRDEDMATIVTGIRSDLYPNEKMIIWAHNAHVAYRQSPLRSFVGNPNAISVPMGNHLKAELGDDIYTIGLYMLRGQTADNSGRSVPISRPLDNSLEALAHVPRQAALFIETIADQPRVAGNEFLFEPIPVHTWGGAFGSFEMVLSDQYDGVIVIDQSSTPRYR